MRTPPPLRAALALLPCLALGAAVAGAGACTSSGAPTLGSVQGTASDGSADGVAPGADGGGADGKSPASGGDASSPTHDGASTGQGDSSTSMSPNDASVNGSDDGPVLFLDAAEFPETGSFDATQPCSNLTCAGTNAAPTCCASDGTCVPSSDTTCGRAGQDCTDCTATSHTCAETTGTCQ